MSRNATPPAHAGWHCSEFRSVLTPAKSPHDRRISDAQSKQADPVLQQTVTSLLTRVARSVSTQFHGIDPRSFLRKFPLNGTSSSRLRAFSTDRADRSFLTTLLRFLREDDLDRDPHMAHLGFRDFHPIRLQSTANINRPAVHQIWKVAMRPFIRPQHETVLPFTRH